MGGEGAGDGERAVGGDGAGVAGGALLPRGGGGPVGDLGGGAGDADAAPVFGVAVGAEVADAVEAEGVEAAGVGDDVVEDLEAEGVGEAAAGLGAGDVGAGGRGVAGGVVVGEGDGGGAGGRGERTEEGEKKVALMEPREMTRAERMSPFSSRKMALRVSWKGLRRREQQAAMSLGPLTRMPVTGQSIFWPSKRSRRSWSTGTPLSSMSWARARSSAGAEAGERSAR